MINSLRHTDLYNPVDYADKRVAIIGVGTIGSHLALTLARMQVPFTMYDDDTIEEHNLATQAYTRRDLGRYKVDAVLKQCEEIGAEGIEAIREKFTPERTELIPVYDSIVSCVDSIDARREIANALIDTHENGTIPPPILDGRVGAEQVEVYYYADAVDWLRGLPEQADTDPCGARFTAYTANVCAGLMANNVKRLLLEQAVKPRILYDAVSSTFLTP